MDVRKLVKPNVRKLRAYEAKEVPCRVKLDANESRYPVKVKVPSLMANRYPDPEARELRKTLARQLGIRIPNILVGNGSDELIYYLITTFGGPVLYPEPTFVMYGIIARALGERAVGVRLDEGFDLDMKPMLQAIKKEKPKLVFLSSPNNPTGNCYSADRMLRIIEASRGIVVVDEAYQAFSSRKGFLPMLSDYPNLVVMRTLSKVGLAALRVGFLIGSEEIVGEVNKVRLPFNLNSYSQALAAEALKDGKQMRAHIGAITGERKGLMRGLDETEGVTAYPSEANFILFRVGDPGKVYKGLLKRGVLVRNMDGVVKGCLRVTVGTERENKIFLKALKETLKTKH
jgi:histidinol-phosphate aminotransferase